MFIPYVNLLTYLHVCTYLLLAVVILPDIPLSKCVYLQERYIKLCKTQCWINIRTTYMTLVKCYYISGSLAIAGYRLFCWGSVFCGSSSCHRDVHYVPSYTVQSYTVKKTLELVAALALRRELSKQKAWLNVRIICKMVSWSSTNDMSFACCWVWWQVHPVLVTNV